MTKKFLVIMTLVCLFFLASTMTASATMQPSGGPPGTVVTWMFETPYENGQEGFQAGEPGDIFFCSQQIDVGDFNVPDLRQGDVGAQQYPEVTVMFTIPETAPTGSCTARARGRNSGFEVTGDFEVTATQVPYTGGSPGTNFPIWLVFIAGGLLLTVGGAVIRRTTKTA